MGIAERRQNEKEAIRKKIIDAASEILAVDGYQMLSIRKIANKIEYSPGIIYHYFKDKNEIISSVVEEGYRNILSKVNSAKIDYENPDNNIRINLREYIELMISYSNQFKAIMLSDIDEIQERVGMLKKGISNERKSIQALCSVLEIGMERGKFRRIDVELTAQIIWSSTNGLITRLIIEKNIDETQKTRLIDHHIDMMINAVLV